MTRSLLALLLCPFVAASALAQDLGQPLDAALKSAVQEQRAAEVEAAKLEKRLYRHVHGVEPGNVPLYRAEYEFRYNHRGEHFLTLLYDRLIRTTIPAQTQP